MFDSPFGMTVRNVNHALPIALMLFRNPDYVRTLSPRGAKTLEIAVPVITVYQNPLERVLFHPARDANPFFHFFEALWILAGYRDVDWLARFLPRIRDYSDDGKVFHGAYGERMRLTGYTNARYSDQLENCIDELRRDPNSRRAVVGIWQPSLDSGYTGKDMPCNCTITFKLREHRLNMVVFNRSNDMVWGAYGANVVQFSTILEYMAARLDVDVGTYTQWSDSFHVYENQESWRKLKAVEDNWALDPYTMEPQALLDSARLFAMREPVRPYPLVEWPNIFDNDLLMFVEQVPELIDSGKYMDSLDYANGYFDKVARPMLNSFIAYKIHKDRAVAEGFAAKCSALDWGLAAHSWLSRRTF